MPDAIIINCPFDHLVQALLGNPVLPTNFGGTGEVRTNYCFEGPLDLSDDE